MWQRNLINFIRHYFGVFGLGIFGFFAYSVITIALIITFFFVFHETEVLSRVLCCVGAMAITTWMTDSFFAKVDGN